MPSPDPRLPLIVIVGPTAVGKTEAAIQLAERLDGEIISADSRLFYRGMDIGTAKPTPEEQARVPHHLIDVSDPDQAWSLARFQETSRKIIAQIHARGRLPFLVGGTGQYIRAVIEEWEVPPQPPKPELRVAIEKWGREIGPQALYDRLALVDPDATLFIQPSNLRRTVRAFEVIFTTGRRFSAQRKKSTSTYRLLQLGLRRPRTELYARIDARVDNMLEQGLVAEVERLLDQGYTAKHSPMSAIGYGEIIDYLRGRSTMDEAARLIKRYTHHYVRRQANWFKEQDSNILWFDAGPGVIDAMLTAVQAWLIEAESTA